MNIFKDDLFKNKYFLFVAGLFALIVFFFYLMNYNSLENKCRRQFEKAGSFFAPKNKLQEQLLNSSVDHLVRECVEKGNK